MSGRRDPPRTLARAAIHRPVVARHRTRGDRWRSVRKGRPFRGTRRQEPGLAKVAPGSWHRSCTSNRGVSPTTATCSCGGRFNLDVQYLFDARRFSLLGQVPILWRCAVCGRSLIEGRTPATADGGSPKPRNGAAGTHRRSARDHCGEALLDSLAVRARGRRSVPGGAAPSRP